MVVNSSSSRSNALAAALVRPRGLSSLADGALNGGRSDGRSLVLVRVIIVSLWVVLALTALTDSSRPVKYYEFTNRRQFASSAKMAVVAAEESMSSGTRD